MLLSHRDYPHQVKTLLFKVVLCTLIFLTTCRRCIMSGMQNSMDHDECGSRINVLNSDLEDVLSDGSRPLMPRSSTLKLNLENVCSQSDLFCFPSTLSGFFSDSHSAEANGTGFSEANPDETLHVGSTQPSSSLCWTSNCGNFKLSSGMVLSCSLKLKDGISDTSYCQNGSKDQDNILSCRRPSVDQKTPRVNQSEDTMRIKSDGAGGFSSLHVHISPPLLNWGQNYLYFPSLAFVTVENLHNHSVLDVYEPHSTNAQFYPCNFSEIRLGPGEIASICVVFLPTQLGLSSAHLILQTSFGGFLVQARGFAVKSSHGVHPLFSYDYSSTGRLSKTISLFNSFDETLHVKEVSAWLSFSLGNTSHSTKAVCSVEDPEGFMFGVEEWLDVKSCQDGQPKMALRPKRTWEIGPNSNETILELELSYHSQGKISGSVCIQFLSASRGNIDAVIVPFEAEFGGRSMSHDLRSFLSISLEVLMPCDDKGTIIVALLLENAGPHLLTVVKIKVVGVNAESFKTKHIGGLMLFPHTVTQVAMVTYTPFATELDRHPFPIPLTNLNCTLLIQTNESDSPELQIPCSDIASLCSRSHSYVGYGHHHGVLDYDNPETRSTKSHLQSPLEVKAIERAKADELMLENWKSQATSDGMSVLDDDEVLFPLVHVGTHQSKWISVKNPSNQPVVMQLLLNSGEIIDECRGSNEALQPPSYRSFVYKDYTNPSRFGFSIAGSALREAYVHPHGRAFLGPVVFHPSGRCTWRSSALVRNNLSGVESLSLRGFGGSLSLLLFEGSDPVQTLEFKNSLPNFLNFSHHDMLSDVRDINHACGEQSTKVLFAKNAGDLPLEVNKIEVSGTECRLDGFVVHTCNGFSLQPGESMKLLISYRTDFSAAVVQRELELAMSGGILVIPMKASRPSSMLMICKRSLQWIRLKRFFVLVLTGLSISMVCYHMFPQVVFRKFPFRDGKCYVVSVGHEEHSPSMHCSQKHGKFMNGMRMDEGETFILDSIRKHPDSSDVPPKPGKSAPCVSDETFRQVQTSSKPETVKEVARPLSPLSSKSVAVESSSTGETAQPGNLTVKTGKEKARRRKKKRGHGTGLTGQFEASSSQSSNSTPSSPLSPFSYFTPNRSQGSSPDVNQQPGTENPFAYAAHVCQKNSGNAPTSAVKTSDSKASMKYDSRNLIFPTKEKPSTPGKSVVLPSSSFPCRVKSASNLTWPLLVAVSNPGIAQHARAPGSELSERKSIKTEEESGNGDQFEYDIWGDHLGLCFTGLSKEVSVVSPLAKDGNSDSFFAKGPQSLLTISKAKSVSSNQGG